jgi:DNA-binding response OmpR family regulator
MNVQGGTLFMKNRILIVDRSSETREVLRTVLEQRGMQILEASATEQGLELARTHRPHVIVVDLERSGPESESKGCGIASQWRSQDARLLFLSGARGKSLDRTAGEFVQKPYHYAPLLRKIEALLDDSPESLEQMV